MRGTSRFSRPSRLIAVAALGMATSCSLLRPLEQYQAELGRDDPDGNGGATELEVRPGTIGSP